MSSERGRLVVISGPSGAGKTTICARLLERGGFERVITCTTRAPRGEERDGVDYRFLDRAEFEAGIARGQFLEHANVYGNYYGTPRAAVEEGIRAGLDLLLNIDVQGARQLREAGIDGLVTVFVEPPDMDTLEARLRRRGTDSDDSIRGRLDVARRELAEREHYDHVITNADLEQAVSDVIQALDRSVENRP